MPVYIAGPIQREWRRLPNWVAACYEVIEAASQTAQLAARRPYIEREIDILSPDEFSIRIQQRIKEADSVVAVFLPNDPSVPVECAFAALVGKRVLLIHNETFGLPRILAGLAGVTAERWGPGTSSTISRFLLDSDRLAGV